MRRLLPVFLWLWGSVVFAFILGAAVNWVFGPPREEVTAFLDAHWRVISLTFLVLGGLALWSWMDKKRWQRAERERQRRQYFALCKPAAAVRLADLDPYDRPHYMYIPRTAVPYDQRSNQQHPQVYAEVGLCGA